ncbi:MAG: xanthine dehydrogenase family protein molybdopterin-binding subunit [Burkholderiales bacterium]|nr:xanthine dehydrogenase family protein molybdopterin-binding subunit [Burkholderiales bacterium]
MSTTTLQPQLSRRSFLASTGAAAGGLMVSFHIPFANAQDSTPEVNAWVVIQPDDTVVIRIARSEMGQGTLTGLAQLVAEELECNWAKVTTEYPTPGQNLARKRVWGNFATGGSRGIRESHDYVRKGGAMARILLVQAAADGWGVPATECVAANSVITHKASGRKTTYGKVAAAAAKLTPPDAASIALKDPKTWKLAGKRLARLDTVKKTTGEQNYGIDLQLPGLLNAAIKDCPVFGGKLKSFNAAAIEGRPGVKKVVQVGDSAVAVVADTWWRAKTALDALPIEWDYGPNARISQADIQQTLKEGLAFTGPTVVGNSNGDAPAAIAAAARKIEAVYTYPFQNHATMEPMNAIWSREEDMQHGSYHPVTQCKLTAGLDAQGNISGLHMRISGQSILATVAPQTIKDGRDMLVFQGLNTSGPEASIGYSFPNLLIDHAMRNPHVPAGFWRGVNLNQNAIYLESFIDEIAHATGQDPLALRRKLMANHPKHLAVLNAVAERAGWDKPAPKGVFRGLAQTMGFGSYVAACAEVSVSDDGQLKIHRIVAATDPGHAVNPQQIEAQVEGSFSYGLSAALFGEITVKDGAVEQKNFDSYPVVRMADMPKVETIVLPSGGFWGGVGEPTIAVAAPAVLNAIFAATGKRIRELPLKQHSLKRA